MNGTQTTIRYEEVVVKELQKVFSKYVPSEFHKEFEKARLDLNGDVEVNIEEFLQNLMDKSKNNFRMYGSGAELADNLAIFEDFPLSFKEFGFEDHFRVTSPYQLPQYRNLKGQLYLTKREFVGAIQLSIRQKYEFMGTEPSYEMNQAMQYFDEINNASYELFRYERYVLDDINQRLFQVSTVGLVEDPFWMDRNPLYLLSFEYLESHFQLTKESFQKSVDEADEYEYDKLSHQYPECFYPVSETEGFYMPAIVRIFEDGDQKFVMKYELFNNTIIKEPYGAEEEKTDILETMDLNEVFKDFRDQVKDIEFIRFPIKHAKHAAVPIVAPDARHYILAADALLQYLHHLISGLQVFQRPEGLDLTLTHLSTFFSPESQCRFFIKTTELDKLKKQADDEIWSGTEAKQVKSVEDFGLKTLIREIKRLGLKYAFPDIREYAEEAYQLVVQNKKEPKLRTCDLIDAIEMCQLSCIFNRYSELKHFMHTQKACHRLPLVQCQLCTIEKAAVKEKHSERSSPAIADSKPEPSKALEDFGFSFRILTLEQELKETSSRFEKLEEKVIKYEQGMKNAEEARVAAELDCIKAQKLAAKKEKHILELQKSRKEFEKLEKTVKKKNTEIDVLERKLKEVRRELEEQKVNKQQREEVEKLKEIIEKLKNEKTEEVEKWKNAVKNKDEEIKKLTDKVAETQKTEVSSRCSNEALQNLIRKMDTNAKNELSKKDQVIRNLKASNCQQTSSNASVIKELQETISTMEEHHEEQSKTIKRLLSRISRMSLPVPSQNSENVRIEKLKNLFNAPGPIELAKEMVENALRNGSKSIDHVHTVVEKC
ncbi:hypothetical protein CAEBREN_20646 [Caenorhabditis brenneri]|uniref:Uncharacterized protein n=1 Tax=Caenorhabditis brenneri TaxID=135651 RepID=G0MWY9_CAEBE|nr:hypothetical protein CAEBREN_20646 [Caenorhabditis brenneri]